MPSADPGRLQLGKELKTIPVKFLWNWGSEKTSRQKFSVNFFAPSSSEHGGMGNFFTTSLLAPYHPLKMTNELEENQFSSSPPSSCNPHSLSLLGSVLQLIPRIWEVLVLFPYVLAKVCRMTSFMVIISFQGYIRVNGIGIIINSW